MGQFCWGRIDNVLAYVIFNILNYLTMGIMEIFLLLYNKIFRCHVMDFPKYFDLMCLIYI